MSAGPIAAALSEMLGGHWHVSALGASGFCDTWQAQRGGERLFVKSSRGAHADALNAEANGLQAIGATKTVRVPAVAALGLVAPDSTLLALEWLDLQPRQGLAAKRFAVTLASLHTADCPLPTPAFGWERDNYIGATLQSNAPTPDASTASWIDFFREHRLQAMVRRLRERGLIDDALDDAVQKAGEAMPRLFDDGYAPRASLIHGDLWQGNWGVLADGIPVVFDPAVSCSDPEAELAMLELFGAPPPSFWGAYREVAGVHRGYARRRALYQLYHLLNHVLLFGTAYVSQALESARAASKL